MQRGSRTSASLSSRISTALVQTAQETCLQPLGNCQMRLCVVLVPEFLLSSCYSVLSHAAGYLPNVHQLQKLFQHFLGEPHSL